MDLRLLEIVAPPDLPVVLDDDPGRLHVELLEQVEQAQAIGELPRLAIERDRDVTHRRATSSRVVIISWSRRAASAGSAASYTARTTATARAPASITAGALSWSIPPTATNGRSITPATRDTSTVPTAGRPSLVGVG